MKIAFLQRPWFESIGIMSLTAMLKKSGHCVEVFIPSAEKNAREAIVRFDPRIICFSCSTGEHVWVEEAAKTLKNIKNYFIVVGGPHPTFFPNLIHSPYIDCICRGEGDLALVELADCLEKSRSYENIPNLHIKIYDKIVANPFGDLITDLDQLPFPAREIYDKYPDLQRHPTKHFITSRGCFFNCGYCYNHLLRSYYPDNKNWVRYHSPEYMTRQIIYIRNRYKLRTVFFDDDVLTVNADWLKKFLNLYKAQVDLPFICNIQAAEASEEKIQQLKKAGCFRVSMGVETGNEFLRKDILKKNVSNAQIIQTADCLKKHDIKILTNNMMGLPHETVEQAWETIDFNIRLKTDYPWCSIFQPYPGTEIEKYVKKEGLACPQNEEEFSATFFHTSPLKQENIHILIRLQKFFFLAIKFPFLKPLIKRIMRWPLDPITHIIFMITFAWRYKQANRLSFWDIVQFSIHNFRLYRGSKDPL